MDGLGEMEAETDEILKEAGVENRLKDPAPVHPRSRLPSTSLPIQNASAITAATSRASTTQLEKTLATTLQRFLDEPEQLMKLGYLTTLKACVIDLERRLLTEQDSQ